MKKVAFPHMGHLGISVKSFLYELGVEPIEPPPTSKKTLDLGVQNAPEFACLPLKINLGNHLESVEKGAEFILMAGGVGPCRFGYFAEVQREILYDLKKEVQMLVIEPNAFDIYQKFNYLHGKFISPLRLYQILRFILKKMKAVDEVERVVQYLRPRAKDISRLNHLYRHILKRLGEAATESSVQFVKTEGIESLYALEDPEIRDVIHIGIVGEIYQILEPYVSLNVEERLGAMGVEVHREMFLSHWVLDHILKRVDRSDYLTAARPYLSTMVGGHGQETVGQAVLYARQGLDGVIQLAPFTCMPEIVAESILPVVSLQEKIPILSLFFDEHSGEAGIQTRLEAFIDLVSRKRERREIVNERISRN